MDIQKEQAAINRLKTLAPKDGEPYWLAYSGGKDSDCIRILAKLAGVPHEIHHNLTTVDAPETIGYIKSLNDVQIDKARYEDGRHKTMWNLIPFRMSPPTRFARYCCSELKEHGGSGHLVVTGVRWSESRKRKENNDVVKILGKPKSTQKMLDEAGVTYDVTKMGGAILPFDNEIVRDGGSWMQHCFRTRKTNVNPIVDWTDDDVWDFLHHYGCESNPLYQCGFKRIGCVGCPLAGAKQMKRQFDRYPQFKANYISAFDRLVEVRKSKGLDTKNWTSGEAVMSWWLGEDTNQLRLFSEEELRG